jgi:curved DNA-binding protein CbpA
MTRGGEPDPYAVLGVPRTASEREIRAAYRELVARYHPDRHQDNPLKDLASEKLAEINRAYAALSNPARRSAFDAGAGGGGGRGEPAPGAPAAGPLRLGKLAALIFLLPFILRFGGPLGRLLEVLLRDAIEALALLRGTPLPAAAVLLAMLGLTLALLRRRRTKPRRSSRTSPGEPEAHGQRRS